MLSADRGNASLACRPPSELRAQGWIGWAGLAALLVALYACCLTCLPLLDPDEGRHAEIAREALVTGNWFTPTLNFEPYHHKPMAYYWLVAAGLVLFPSSPEFGARLPSVLAALFSVGAVAWWTARTWGPSVAWWAATILGTSVGFVVAGRAVLVDMSFTWWVTAAHLALALTAVGSAAAVPWWTTWVCLGVAMLFKGPAAVVLVAGTAVVYAAWTRRWRWLRSLRPHLGIIVSLSIAGIWYGLAFWADPAYMLEFLWTHNVERFLSGQPGHPENPFYFAYVLPAICLPWSLFWPLAWPQLRRELRERHAATFCACWAFTVLAFFTVSRSKLPFYVLPAFPPLAILTAVGLADIARGSTSVSWAVAWIRSVYQVVTYVSVGAAALGWVILHALQEPELANAVAVVFMFTAAVLVLATWKSADPTPLRQLYGLAGATATGLLALYGVAGSWLGQRYSLVNAATVVREEVPEARLASLKAGFTSLLFYSGKPVRRTASAEECVSLLSQQSPAVVLVKKDLLPETQCRVSEPVYVLWSGERRKVLIANRPGNRGEGSIVHPANGCAPK